MATCSRCGFRFYSRDFTDAEASSYYREYRTETYYEERHRFEPFYTRRVHVETEDWLASEGRRQSLAEVLVRANAPSKFRSVLDYGGGTGALIRNLVADRKAVFDVSEVVPEANLEHLRDQAKVGTGWELVICAQVLEHVAWPSQMLADMVSATTPGGGFCISKSRIKHGDNRGCRESAWTPGCDSFAGILGRCWRQTFTARRFA